MLNRNELTKRFAKAFDMPRSEATDYVDAVFDLIFDALNNGEDVHVGMFRFTHVAKPERAYRNPIDGKYFARGACTTLHASISKPYVKALEEDTMQEPSPELLAEVERKNG